MSAWEVVREAWTAMSSDTTITLAVIGCLLYPMADLYFRYRDFGPRGLSEYWGYRVKYSVVIAVGWLVILYSWHLFRIAA